MAKRGRPQEHDPDQIVRALCARISEGELVTDVAEELGVTKGQIWDWTDGDRGTKELSDLYARARIAQAHSLAEKALRIAEGSEAMTVAMRRAIESYEEELQSKGTRGWKGIINSLNFARIQRDSLRVQTLKWFTSKIAPRLYGDKLDITSGDKPIVPQTLGVHFVGAPSAATEDLKDAVPPLPTTTDPKPA